MLLLLPIEQRMFNKRWISKNDHRNHAKCPRYSFDSSLEFDARNKICGLIYIVGPESKVWDTDQQSKFIRMLEVNATVFRERGAGAIWATVVLFQAFDVAAWATKNGITSLECEGHHHRDDDDATYVPYDASKWLSWVQDKLVLHGLECGDISMSGDHIKQVAAELVRRKFIKIPMNSGLPLYHWLLEGHARRDFCRIYGCLVFAGPRVKYTCFDEMKVCLRDHMDHLVAHNSGFRFMRGMLASGPFDTMVIERESKYAARIIGKAFLMFRDRARHTAAARIQSFMRGICERKSVDELSLRPDHLFSAEHTTSRKRKFGIEDWRFGSELP